MGLPSIKIAYEKLAKTIMSRSQRGVVALIVKDDTATLNSYEFTKLDSVDKTKFSTKVYGYIEKAFLGNPGKVLVEVINTSNSRTVSTILEDLKVKKFNYLAVPEISMVAPEGTTKTEVDEVATWIKAEREKGREVKAVLPNCEGDNEGIINFVSTGIKEGNTEITTAEFCVRLAGVFAGLPLSQSATYYTFSEITEVDAVDNPDNAVDAGKIFLINDGEKIKLSRAVNSLVTLGEKKKDLQKIKIVEALDLIKSDIRKVFEDKYIGKISNKYENKMLFVAETNTYFIKLQKLEALDPDAQNYIDVDTEKNKEYLEEEGKDTSKMEEAEIRKGNTGSHLFVAGQIQTLDAMEDLDLVLYI